MENNECYEEIDLWELIMHIWHHKITIFISTISFILIAGIYSFFLAKPVYEVSSEIYTPEFRLLNDNVISHNDYISFLRNAELKEKLIERYNLDKDYNITLDSLDKKLVVNVDKKKNNVVLSLKDTDNKLAVKLLNDWVELFSARVKNYVNGINLNYLNSIETLMLDRDSAYSKAEEALTEFEKTSNLDLIKAQLETKTSKLVEFESEFIDLSNDIIVLEEKNKVLTEQVDKTEKFIITNTSIDNESLKILNKLFANTDLQSLTTKQENINEIYLSLQSQKNKVEMDLIANKERLKFLKTSISDLNKEIAGLKEKEAVLSEEKKRLEKKADESIESYQLAQQEYSRLQQELKKIENNITVINRAYIPESPVSPNKKLNLVIATVLGFFLGIFVVFIKNFLAEYPEEEVSQ